MGKRENFNQKIMVFLSGVIIFICISLLFISCGRKPQEKVQILGSYSLDTKNCPDTCGVYVGSQLFDMANRGLTIEAWIKNVTDADDPDGLNGVILSRNNEGGVQLYVKRNVPKFKIILNVGGTSTFTVSSGIEITPADGWTHVAGVLADEDHSSVHPNVTCKKGDNSSPTGGEAEVPHLDIYINGELKACAPSYDTDINPNITSPNYVPNDRWAEENGKRYRELFIGYLGLEDDDSYIDDNDNGRKNDAKSDGIVDEYDDVFSTVKFEGYIDEVRFWKTARSAELIRKCMRKKLDLSSGDCGRNNPDLGGYWSFDEGKGSSTSDLSGNGNAGSIFSPHGYDYENGWSTDVPF